MRKPIIAVCLTALFALAASTAEATPWHVMGPRAVGMGGAQVAIAQGPLASYWNPAGLGQLYNESGLNIISIGLRGAFTGSVLEGANDLFEVQKQCAANGQAAGGICNQANITDALDKLNQAGNGAIVDVGGNISVKIKRLVLFVNSLSYVGVTPRVSFSNNTEATLNNNISKLVLRGITTTEFGIGYGHELFETGIVLGANLKGIAGKVGYDELNIVSEEPEGGNFSDFKDQAKSSFQPGIDAGLFWDMRESLTFLPFRPRFALVGRNLNNPKFKQPDAAKNAGDRAHYKINGQARAGFAISPFKFWHITADIDLTDNITPIDGFKQRMLGAGTEINVFNRPWLNIPLRAGLQKNISKNADTSLAYTGGFGLHFVWVNVDLGGSVSSKSTSIQTEGETQKVPNNFAFAARVGVLFGGVDEGRRGK